METATVIACRMNWATCCSPWSTCSAAAGDGCSEQTLSRANEKFERRFRADGRPARQQADMRALSLEALDALWDSVKQQERNLTGRGVSTGAAGSKGKWLTCGGVFCGVALVVFAMGAGGIVR